MKTNSNIYIYSLSHYLFLGLGFSTLLKISGKDTYIAGILGFLLGIIILYIIYKLSKFRENILFRIIYFIYLILNIILLFLILSNFLFSYFLPFTSSFISCLPFLLLAIYLSSKEKEVISNIASILLILSIFIIFLKSLLLINNIELSNLTPILSIQTTSLFKSTFIYTLLTTFPLLLLINEELDFKKMLKYYSLSNLTNILNLLFITLILGNISSIYSFPEYAILRRINILSFIENIENFICLNWFFDLFITLTILLKKLKANFHVSSNLIPLLITLPLLYIINNYFSNNFLNTILLYNNYIYLILIIFFLLILVILYAKKKPKIS